MNQTGTISADLFDQHYRAAEDGDPFNYLENRFERTKYAVQLALLSGERFSRGLELGCSIGVFTEMAAPLFDHLLGVDCSAAAIATATARCAALPNVRFGVRDVPDDFPLGPFDFVCMAEMGYYLDAHDLAMLRDAIARETVVGARVLVTHMTIDFKTYMGQPIPSGFDDVHGGFIADPRFLHLSRIKGYDIAGDADFSNAELYVCDLFERTVD